MWLVSFLLVILIGVTGVGEQKHWTAATCPPDEQLTYCTVAEDGWTMVRFDMNWQRLALVSQWGIDLVDPYSGQSLGVSVLPPVPWTRFTGLPSFSPDGLLIASAMSDGTVRIWETESGMELQAFPSSLHGSCVAFSRQGGLIAAQGPTGDVVVWDITTGELLLAFPELQPYRHLCVLAFCPDDSRLFVLGIAPGSGAQITGMWDIASGNLVRVFPGTAVAMPDGSLYTLEPRPDGSTQVSIWDGVLGPLVRTFLAPGPMKAASFSHDSRYLALSLSDGTVSLWDMLMTRELYRLDLQGILKVSEGREPAILHLTFSPDNTLLATGTWVWGTPRAYVHLWNISRFLTEQDAE